MRILMLEDDVVFGTALQKALQRAGHAVDWLQEVSGLIGSMTDTRYECVLLDLGLPAGDGEACLRQIRLRDAHLPVIVITARGSIPDRIRLLEAGADDYIVKPVDLDEVNMRVQVVTRRVQISQVGSAELKHGPLTLVPASRITTWHGKVVPLTTREFWLLEILVRKKDKVLSRIELEEALYGWGDDINSNAIEVYIHFLRKKVDPGIIKTIRGLGYQLAPEIADDR